MSWQNRFYDHDEGYYGDFPYPPPPEPMYPGPRHGYDGPDDFYSDRMSYEEGGFSQRGRRDEGFREERGGGFRRGRGGRGGGFREGGGGFREGRGGFRGGRGGGFREERGRDFGRGHAFRGHTEDGGSGRGRRDWKPREELQRGNDGSLRDNEMERQEDFEFDVDLEKPNQPEMFEFSEDDAHGNSSLASDAIAVGTSSNEATTELEYTVEGDPVEPLVKQEIQNERNPEVDEIKRNVDLQTENGSTQEDEKKEEKRGEPSQDTKVAAAHDGHQKELKGPSKSSPYPATAITYELEREQLGKESVLMRCINSSKTTGTLIGLSYVTEYQCTVGIKCVCSLCGIVFSPHNGPQHIVGIPHHIMYLRQNLPQEFARLKYTEFDRPDQRKRKRSKVVLLMKDIESKVGIGEPKIAAFDFQSVEGPESRENCNAGSGCQEEVSDEAAKRKERRAFEEFVEKEYKRTRRGINDSLTKENEDSFRAYKWHPQFNPDECRDPPDDPYLNHSPYPPPSRPPHPFHPSFDRPPHPDPFYHKRPMRGEPYLDRRGEPYLDRRGEPYLDPNSIRRPLREEPYFDPDPLRGPLRPDPYLDPELMRRRLKDDAYYARMQPDLELMRRPVPDALNKGTPVGSYLHPDPLNFDEPFIDPDPLKRVLPSQKAAKRPVVIDYGHGSEKKSATEKADEWEKDFKDIVNKSKAPDSLGLLSSTYSSPKREDTPPRHLKKDLPFSKSYIERSILNRELSSSNKRKDRSPSSSRAERRGRSPSHRKQDISRRREKSRSPIRRYRRSRSSERFKQKIKYERKRTVEKNPHSSESDTNESDSLARKYRRSKSPQDRDSTFSHKDRGRSPAKSKKVTEANAVLFQDRNRRPSFPPENLSRLPGRKRQTAPRHIGPIIDLTIEDDIDHCDDKEVCTPPRQIEEVPMEKPPEPQTSDDVDVDDAHAEMIADMLLKMQNPLVGQDEVDPQSALKAFLSQDLTQLLLATKQITQEVPSSPIKRTKRDKGEDVQGDLEKRPENRPGPSRMKVDTKAGSKSMPPSRDKITFGFSGRSNLSSRSALHSLEEDAD